MARRKKILILGAAGRDFHNFNVAFRADADVEVVAFTATQIPNIEGRLYPAVLAGPAYPNGIPIHPESELERLIAEHAIDEAVFAYSDVSYDELMQRGARVLAAGADFRLLGPKSTFLESSKPVVSVCAVRTGVGKSPTTRRVAAILREAGLSIAILRHPMPYGDLAQQAVQRFASLADMKSHDCTIEEMEEYEPHVEAGNVVFAGVDYERILREAEKEADVILWDGGNNDLPFVRSDLEIVLVDPHRPGDERRYFPGQTNMLRADVIVLSKVGTAKAENVEAVRRSAREANPNARIVEADLALDVDEPERLKGARVLVVEDGPTTTHGGMAYGAGAVAARKGGAKELVDPRPAAVGSLRETFEKYPHLTEVCPAMGYGDVQVRELEATIRGTSCDAVVIATPVDLRRLMTITQPTVRVSYRLANRGEPTLEQALSGFVAKAKGEAK